MDLLFITKKTHGEYIISIQKHYDDNKFNRVWLGSCRIVCSDRECRMIEFNAVENSTVGKLILDVARQLPQLQENTEMCFKLEHQSSYEALMKYFVEITTLLLFIQILLAMSFSVDS